MKNIKLLEYINTSYNNLKPIVERRLSMLVLSFFLATMAGCDRKIKEGVVFEKIYESPEEKIEFQYIPQDETILTIPIMKIDDEDYIIKIRKQDPNTGRYRIREFYVDSSTFARIRIGDYFVFNGENAGIQDLDE